MRLREVGGMMRPIWSSYYSDCSMLIFVVDASVDELVEAGTALRTSLADFREVNAGAHVLVVLNKVDSVVAASLLEGEEDARNSLRQMMTENVDIERDHNGMMSTSTDGTMKGDGDASSSSVISPPPSETFGFFFSSAALRSNTF